MALKHLDLEEQEQLDKIKAFWKQFGNRVWLDCGLQRLPMVAARQGFSGRRDV
jgi:predicted negative regulator of RcsB-dependent stress response